MRMRITGKMKGFLARYSSLLLLSALFLAILFFINKSRVIFFLGMVLIVSFFAVMFFFPDSAFFPQRAVRIINYSVLAVLAIILVYIVSVNLGSVFFDSTLRLSLDVGSEKEYSSFGITALKPFENIGEPSDSYRELLRDFIYFTVSMPRNAARLNISIRFRDRFPQNLSDGFYAVARKTEEGGSVYLPLYLPGFGKFFALPKIQEEGRTLFFLGSRKQNYSTINSFLDNVPEGSVIATNLELEQEPAVQENYSAGSLDINVSIRGSHTFFTYASGKIELTVSKQDLNWYAGRDSLLISLYDWNSTLIKNATIPDDGIIERRVGQAVIQKTTLVAYNLSRGVYKIGISNNGDMLITGISINQAKLVADGILFLSDNEVYRTRTSPSELFSEGWGSSPLRVLTYHREGWQNITVGGKKVNVNNSNIWFDASPGKNSGLYSIKSPRNDIIITSFGYFSFTRDSYFNPFGYRIVGLEDAQYADYILTDYKEPADDGSGWLIGTAELNASDLDVQNRKLDIILDARHLSNRRYENYTIPVDWINVTIYRKGLFGHS